jgi:hypothetical protein
VEELQSALRLKTAFDKGTNYSCSSILDIRKGRTRKELRRYEYGRKRREAHNYQVDRLVLMLVTSKVATGSSTKLKICERKGSIKTRLSPPIKQKVGTTLQM